MTCRSPRCASASCWCRRRALLDATLRANAPLRCSPTPPTQRSRRPERTGLTDWLETLPWGLDTRVGQRGESLSAGSGGNGALVRAHLADPDLLVLDEATSAVDPALESADCTRPLERLQRGRTSVTIAHRMSTAENADEVVVVDKGRIVQRGLHARLVAEGGVYGASTPPGSPSSPSTSPDSGQSSGRAGAKFRS